MPETYPGFFFHIFALFAVIIIQFLTGSAGKMNEVCTAVMESEREDCGYYGIGSEECLSNKCCWMPSEVPNTPWCFFPSGKILYKRILTNFRPGSDRPICDYDTVINGWFDPTHQLKYFEWDTRGCRVCHCTMRPDSFWSSVFMTSRKHPVLGRSCIGQTYDWQ